MLRSNDEFDTCIRYGKIRITPSYAVMWQDVKNTSGKIPENKGEIRTTKVRKKTKAALKRRVEILAEIVRFTSRKLIFITLTLTEEQKHNDKEVKRLLLNLFLIKMKRLGIIAYVCKSEKQKNGNIHFHLIMDKFIDKEVIRKAWLQSLRRGQYQADMENITKYPCSDVRAIKGVNQAVIYVSKYISKESDQEILGRAISMSKNLSNIDYPVFDMIVELEKSERFKVTKELYEINQRFNIDWQRFFLNIALQFYGKEVKLKWQHMQAD